MSPRRSRQSVDAERVRIASLLQAYGSLLTQRQLSLAQQFCSEKKNFSQIAREREVSRQAVHEAIRSVQQQLELFEMKLKLVEKRLAPVPTKSSLVRQLHELRIRLANTEGEINKSDLIRELDDVLENLILLLNRTPEEAPTPVPGLVAAESHSA